MEWRYKVAKSPSTSTFDLSIALEKNVRDKIISTTVILPLDEQLVKDVDECLYESSVSGTQSLRDEWSAQIYMFSIIIQLKCLCSGCAALGDEPGPGGALVSGHALLALRAHGLLSVHSLGVCHHHVQDAVPAQCGQPSRVLQ